MNIDLEDIIQKQVNCINVFTLLNIRNRFITVSIYIYQLRNSGIIAPVSLKY